MDCSTHYNIYLYPRGHNSPIPGDMSMGILFPDDMSPGKTCRRHNSPIPTPLTTQELTEIGVGVGPQAKANNSLLVLTPGSLFM
ncbi:hypothetical protein Tco_0964763 [Tanacetum coccineum]